MPNPSDFSTRDEFMSACVSERQDEGNDENSDQSVAVCSAMWDDSKSVVVTRKFVTPIEVGAAGGQIDGVWTLSTKNPDRVGDTIEVSALKKNIGKTIPALFGHSHGDIVGVWMNLRMKGEALIADLKLAAVDQGIKLKALMDAGVPISASIGFRGKGKANEHGGIHFKELDIFEASLVAVPCNAEAVRIKALELGVDAKDLFEPAVPERLLTLRQKVSLKRAAAALSKATQLTTKSD